MKEVVELVVVGAGPAGMSAAVAAREQGVEVLVLDEQAAPGGQIYRNVEAVAAGRPLAARALGEEYLAGADIVREFASAVPATCPSLRCGKLALPPGDRVRARPSRSESFTTAWPTPCMRTW